MVLEEILELEPIISTVGVIIAVAISAAAIIQSNKTAQKQTHDTAYTDIDEQIIDFLKTAVEHPELRDPAKTNNYLDAFKGDDVIRYEAYANICWNVCEAVFDKMLDDKKISDEKTRATWEPVIIAENNRHREWLKNSRHGFKDTFLVYMRIKRPQTRKERECPQLGIPDDYVE